jgi:acetyltransferase-like isoleucine patch superfamily enzyme
MTAGGAISLGESVTLLSRSDSNSLQLSSPCSLCLLRPGARISIGDASAASGAVICAATSVRVGRRVLLGANCKILDTDFHPLTPEARLNHPTRDASSEPVVIGDDVFVGAHALILKGVVLGDGCVVGAGAVVSGTFPARSVIAGNPARTIKTLISTGEAP